MQEPSMRTDRTELLGAVDLEALFDGVVGPAHRNGHWSCPSPVHDQTGGSPPVTIYPADGRGPAHWHCYGCGAHGTAIDVLMLSAGLTPADACNELRRLAGVPRTSTWNRRAGRQRPQGGPRTGHRTDASRPDGAEANAVDLPE